MTSGVLPSAYWNWITCSPPYPPRFAGGCLVAVSLTIGAAAQRSIDSGAAALFDPLAAELQALDSDEPLHTRASLGAGLIRAAGIHREGTIPPAVTALAGRTLLANDFPKRVEVRWGSPLTRSDTTP
jgi:hypothetical protein